MTSGVSREMTREELVAEIESLRAQLATARTEARDEAEIFGIDMTCPICGGIKNIILAEMPCYVRDANPPFWRHSNGMPCLASEWYERRRTRAEAEGGGRGDE